MPELTLQSLMGPQTFTFIALINQVIMYTA